MPALDLYHDQAKNALVRDGWTITHDPLRLKWGGKDMYVDLGAEKIIAAEKGTQKIAVEVKSFIGASEMNDIENAMGKYVVYASVITRTEPDRKLYLGIHEETYLDIFESPLGELLLEDYQVHLMVFDLERERVIKWIP